MKILALEFSSDERSVAVGESNATGVRLVNERVERSVTGLALVDRVLQGAGVSPAEIEVVAVGLGPGSYTGIRSAIALSQGWQLGRGVKLVGISSVEVLARDAQVGGLRGSVSLVIDAQRQECYLAECEMADGETLEVGPLRIVRFDEIRADQIVGPGTSRFIPSAKDLYPSAATLLKIAASRSEFVPGESLEPIYLRETKFVKAAPARFS